jgi:conjugative relaxase-like TrwC/TraI family protein
MGLDLTFSMPKSASVLALVGGDSRLLEAHRQAVRETMQWVEKTMPRCVPMAQPQWRPVRSGNLVWAMFEHDTSRKLDPQSHIHVVVAAISQAANGDCAPSSTAIWSANATIGSVYHAQFREKVEALGYGTELSGKHGQFEISDVPREVSRAFSQRREKSVERVAALGIATPQGQDTVVLGTRDNKTNVEDKARCIRHGRSALPRWALMLRPWSSRLRRVPGLMSR